MIDFNFQSHYILEDDAVLLRPLQTNDYDQLLEYAVNEPTNWDFNSGGPVGPEGLSKYINKAVANRDAGKEYPFIVFDKRAEKYIGSTRYYNFDADPKIIELGYTWYDKKYQGTGINKNCKYLLFGFAFDQLGLLRVGLRANAKNQKSINAMKSVGCTVEGIMRSRGYDARGNRIDSVFLSILKSEWENEWREKLKEMAMKTSSIPLHSS